MKDPKRYDRNLIDGTLCVSDYGKFVKWEDYARLKDKSACQTECLDAFDKKLRDAEEKVKHLDLFKSVVEKFFNSADLKNHLDAQSCYALAEKLKQLPDSILDFTEEQVRDNPAWALAVFRHKVKEMQYKRIHDLNAIGGEQEENARLQDEVERLKEGNECLDKMHENEMARSAYLCEQVERLEPELEQRCRELNLSLAQQAIQLRQIGELKDEVERLTTQVGADAIDREHGMCCDSLSEVTRLKAEVKRLRKAGDDMASSIQFNEEMEKDYDGSTIVHPSVERWNEAKEGKQS